MGAVVLLWPLALLAVTASEAPEPHYLVAFPAVINYPGTGKFCVLLQSLPETVHLEVTLEMKSQNLTLVGKDVEKPCHFECLSFQVPPFSPGQTKNEQDLVEEVAHVHVRIHTGDSVRFEGRKKVLVIEVYRNHLIVTDKVVYKAGETVRFRIVKLDDEFKAINQNISLVQLKDPDENRIGQWLDVPTQQGIVDLSFPLASEAAQGMYTIQVGTEDDIVSRQLKRAEFIVNEYVLPRFEVTLGVPSLVTTSDKEIRVNVTGKYTYGKPVRGSVQLTLKRDVSFYFWERTENETLDAIEKEYTAQTDEIGCASFTIKAEDINLSLRGYKNDAVLFADLTEEGTGVTGYGMTRISFVTKDLSVQFIKLSPFYKRGFPYAGKMRCTVNNRPVKNQTIYLTVDVNDVETSFPYLTDENGEAHFSLDTAQWNDTLVALRGRYSFVNMTAEDPADLHVVRNEAFRWLKPFYSESNSFLEIQQVEGELPCGKDQEVLVDYILDRKELGSEADHVDFYYLVASKGKIISSGQKQVPVAQEETLKGTFALTLPISMEWAPKARLLLFTVFADGEVAADVEVFSIEECLRHQVKLGFSEEEGIPGSKVLLQVEAAPRALCSLRAVDKSITLKEDRHLTPGEVYKVASLYEEESIIGERGFDYHVEDFEPYPCLPSEGPKPPSQRRRRALLGPWYESHADAYSLFKQLRMKLLTNTQVKKPVSCRPLPERRILKLSTTDISGQLVSAEQERDDTAPETHHSEEKPKKRDKPRTHFPETWIWKLVALNEEGKASHSVTAPDTITEWRADAFCVADLGIGLAKPATYRVFQPFFVDLVMPKSVVRGESFELKAIVFNYLPDCIQVNVQLAESQQVQVEPCLSCRFTLCLCAEEAQTFSWNVTATQLGHVNLSVTTEAQETQELCGNKISVTPTHGRSDTVVKPLLVKPEGVLKEETHNAILCSSGDPARKEFPLALAEEFALALPVPVVEDSGRATFSVIGDILGTALQNVDRLLQMPFGCGEQNMVKFVPNIFILRYLMATRQATPEIIAKGTEYMKKGYQRQLLYRHDDGSYSAFGKRDAEGNTWLTAFVVRAFVQARSYIYVDEKHIQQAIQWLLQHQLPSGCFESVGKLFNNALKGGVNDNYTLTAYVLTSLQDISLEMTKTAEEDALACLKRNLSSVHEAYPRSLLAYVFAQAGDIETRRQLLNDLKEQIDRDGESAVFSETETAAYFLMALLTMPEVSAEDITEASKVATALIKQQNAYGGFSTTLDTTVALEALSFYAVLSYREIEHVKVLVTSATGFQHEFHVDKGNRLLLQQTPLPEVPGQYKAEVSGSGCVYVQSTLRYNHPPKKADVFTLKLETSPHECNQTSRKRFDIHVQVSYVGPRESSNMALIEVNMVSGFVPVKKSVSRLEGTLGVKKIEFDPDKITFYLDELDAKERSYQFSVEQEVEVTGLKPATVKVYDYYHPEDHAVAEYNAPCGTEVTQKDIH